MSKDGNNDNAGALPSEPEPPGWTPAVRDLLDVWKARASEAASMQFRAANRTTHRYLALGLPVIVLATIVATSLFALQELGSIGSLPILVLAIVSLLVAVLATWLVFGTRADRAAAHRNAAENYAAAARSIREAAAAPPNSAEKRRELLDSIRLRLDDVSAEAPEIGRASLEPRAWIREDLRTAQRGKATYTEKLEGAEGDDIFKYLVLISTSGLDGYIAQTRLQAEQSFRLSRVVAVAGFALISTGIALGVYYTISGNGTLDAAYLSAVAGLITEFVSGVFVYLYNRTLQQLNRFHDRMISSQNVAISLLASTLQDQAATSELARILMSNVSSEAAQLAREATGP